MDPFNSINNTQDLKSFLSSAGPFLSFSHNIKLSYSYRTAITKIVCDLLKVRDNFELNDRFDGIKFRNKISHEVLGYAAFIKFYENINLNLAEKAISKNYQAFHKINGKKVRILTTEWGVFPSVEESISYPTILIFRKDELLFSIFGYASKEVLQNTKKKAIKTSVDIKNKYTFSDFDTLSFFRNKEELNALIH